MILLEALTRLGTTVDRWTYWIGVAVIVGLLIAIVGHMAQWRCWTPEFGKTRDEQHLYAKAITLANVLLTLPMTVLMLNRADTTANSHLWIGAALIIVVLHNISEWLGWNGRPAEPSYLALAFSFAYIFVVVHLG